MWYNKPIFFKYSFLDILKSFVVAMIIIICISLVSMYTHIQLENLKESRRFTNINQMSVVDQKDIVNAINSNTKIIVPNFTIDKILKLSPDSENRPIIAYVIRDDDTGVKYLYLYIGGKKGGPAITRYWDKE